MNANWKYERWRHARIQALEAYVLTAQHAQDHAYIAQAHADLAAHVLPQVQEELTRLRAQARSECGL